MAPTVVEVKTVKSLADLGIKDLPPNYVKEEDERPMVAYNDFSKEVPVISLAKARDGGAARAEVIRELRGACEEWGLFQITDHGVPTELSSQIMRCAEEFFCLPVQEKMQYAIQAGQFVGYGNGSFINDDPLMDWRELYVTTCSPALDVELWSDKPAQFSTSNLHYNPHPDSIVYPLDGLMETQRENPAPTRFERYVYREFYQKKMIKHLLDREIKRSKGNILIQKP